MEMTPLETWILFRGVCEGDRAMLAWLTDRLHQYDHGEPDSWPAIRLEYEQHVVLHEIEDDGAELISLDDVEFLEEE